MFPQQVKATRSYGNEDLRQPGDIDIEDTVVEPELALKLGRFSCFCVCLPRSAAAANGRVDTKAVTSPQDGRVYEVEEDLPQQVKADGGINHQSPKLDSAIGAAPAAQLQQQHQQEQKHQPQPQQLQQQQQQQAEQPSPGVAAPEAPAETPPPPPPGPQGPGSALGATVRCWQQAVVGRPGPEMQLHRESFIEGCAAYADVLEKLGGMGKYLQTNVDKLRRSKANPAEEMYRPWMMSELPTHAASKYKGFVDDSAWMGNLWIGWTLEFFVEMFACLQAGSDTKTSVDTAYKKTLYNHHNFWQRQAFTTAATKIPKRQDIYELLRGRATPQTVEEDVGAFVAVGRPLVAYILQVSEDVNNRMMAERKAKFG